jgi:hypothetical protein
MHGRAKARFDAEQWWYQGNGSVDIVTDVSFIPAYYADRGIILYGNAITNAVWSQLLADNPIQISPGAITIEERCIMGNDLACLFLRPRSDSDVACVASVSGTGIKSMQLTDRLQYIFAGCNYPDCIVIGSKMLRKGTEGVRVAGVFGSDRGAKSGSFAWADWENTATDTVEPDELPFSISMDRVDWIYAVRRCPSIILSNHQRLCFLPDCFSCRALIGMAYSNHRI